LYLESAEIIFKTMPQGTASMSQVSNRIAEALSGNSSKLPIYNKSLALRNESLMLYGVMESFYGIVNKPEYANYTADNTEIYNAVMAEVEALVGTELSIKSIDGESTETVVVSEGMVRFCQYMFAYTSERFDEAYEYLEKVYELEPDYVWLYGYELAIVNIKNGDFEKAEEFAKIILDNNKEKSDGYCVYSSIARMKGDTKKAIEWVDTGLKYCPQDSELLRVKAMALVVEGDLEEAKTVIDNALNYSEYGILYYTAIVVENELGNTETVNNMIVLLENNGLELSDKLNNYLSGKITAKQMFTEGSGEVE
jgi:tetratricopeptide (TPR) repeat protein